MKVFSETCGFVLAATASGVGKTTTAAALCRALSDSGRVVQPFKVGPDYVDTTYLTLASGRRCRNLDGFPNPDLMPFFYEEGCRAEGRTADIAVVEGVMGMYDGLGAEGLYSAAWVARTLGLPVILLVDARASATSLAAVVRGFASLEPLAPEIRGVIANRVSGDSHARLIAEALELYAGIPLLGWLPNTPDISFPSRHLGLVPAGERGAAEEGVCKFAALLKEHVDLEQVVKIAGRPSGIYREAELPEPITLTCETVPRVALAQDNAFCFNYIENIELLHKLGAEVVKTSPLSDRAIPDGTNLLILPGGYPEEFGEELSANTSYMASVREFAKSGAVYAESGGMLYLSKEIEQRGANHRMTGILESRGVMTGRLQRFGYVLAEVMKENLMFKRGETVRAHEFHHSKLDEYNPDVFRIERASGRGEGWIDGYADAQLLATYLHINFYSCPHALKRALVNSIS